MSDEKQVPHILLEQLTRLVTDTNTWLSSCCENYRSRLEAVHGMGVHQRLTDQKGVQISKLQLEIPCYAPLPFWKRFGPNRADSVAVTRLIPGDPTFFRKIFKCYKKYRLCFETGLDGSDVKGQFSLQIPDKFHN